MPASLVTLWPSPGPTTHVVDGPATLGPVDRGGSAWRVARRGMDRGGGAGPGTAELWLNLGR